MPSSPKIPTTLNDQELNCDNLKQLLEQFWRWQQAQFFTGCDVSDLVHARSHYIDQLLCRLWDYFQLSQSTNLSLIAVGGYGRGELHPLSDVDILILATHSLTSDEEQQVSQFLTLLWDLKLEVGHSVRTLDECYQQGANDLTIATNLQESRLITGEKNNFEQLITYIHSEHFWPSETFFQAKLEEQRQRHARYHDTTYNLEPDIKTSPGGLRDIHTLAWIARRHFGATSLFEMSRYGFLTDAEYRELAECQAFLWHVRFALHLQLKRYDNRLTFAHQATVAESLGYHGEGNQAVEKMMKSFFRTLRRVSELNKMLLQLFEQAILENHDNEYITILDDDFQMQGSLIEARKPVLFQARPETILDLFLHITHNPNISGISAPTLRQLRTAKRRLNISLCELPEAREKFMALLRHPNVLDKAVPLMHLHGVFSAYLPQWSQIVGQMQFDLFHVYTVDEHTIRVLKNINKFNLEENRERHPISCRIFPSLAKKELLYLAAIFHDIGKGRGGDHSEIGAIESYQFCLDHGLSRPEAKLVSWLVEQHLLMSVTAQRRDIYDPDVITEFAKKVRDEERLSYLLCLTVADICATNSDLWNSWKASLLTQLFYSTQKALRRGLENPPDMRERIRHNQTQASALLIEKGFDKSAIQQLWLRFKADYFLRHNYQQIAWHGEHLLQHDNEQPLILVSHTQFSGGTEIFIHAADRPSLFATVVSILDKKNLSVHDAQVMSSKDHFALDTFLVLDQSGQAIAEDRHIAIIKAIGNALTNKPNKIKSKKIPKKLSHFNVPTQTSFILSKNRKRSMMELIALDTPGLLAKVGSVFAEQKLTLHSAKITTIGERAEDFFILTNEEGHALTIEQQEQLTDKLQKITSENCH
ncbi:bifunctional uridylyltransferase/uridylyl-removing protein GlnD [Vibrio sp. SS-MA-C1-2]|uniref:bifunctional uridylyltransferase/uridylyl-removing protein GlnD n=1 Tax=Vibrio sp. SS-MA-C1-2 TaxID=2908646 RepID=UPI001F48E466|nr:bifunctional uridylyltransferase/uridylyl-removing protein GlnD [Vibrio sp. SS-MA-C1-2]UJF18905.1 bifunctional uridylyltransferase/uridylyl-removing protein GlnD [Vibrio sp. SS-MA-C1-2]